MLRQARMDRFSVIVNAEPGMDGSQPRLGRTRTTDQRAQHAVILNIPDRTARFCVICPLT